MSAKKRSAAAPAETAAAAVEAPPAPAPAAKAEPAKQQPSAAAKRPTAAATLGWMEPSLPMRSSIFCPASSTEREERAHSTAWSSLGCSLGPEAVRASARPMRSPSSAP